jgi:hypothetical protein
MSCTHTYAVLDVSKPTFDEIKGLLEKAGYQHAFDTHDGRLLIDMHGIALADENTKSDEH